MGWQTLKNALVLCAFDRAFNEVEAWIERELREEDGMGNETKLSDDSTVKEWTSDEILAAMKPNDAPEAPGASLRMALENHTEIKARELRRRWEQRTGPICETIPTWELYNEVQFRLTQVEAEREELRAEIEQLRKQGAELTEKNQRFYIPSAREQELAKERDSARADAEAQRLRADTNYTRGEALAKGLDCGADGNDLCQKPKPTDPDAPQWAHACAACWWARAIDFRDERDSARKDRDELQVAKNAAYLASMGPRQALEDRVAKLESFPHQQVLDRLRTIEERHERLRNEMREIILPSPGERR